MSASTVPAVEKPETVPQGPAPEFDDVEQRLFAVGSMLLDGLSREDILDRTINHWSVSRRTAQLYLQKVQERFRAETQEEDRLFYLRLAQLQHDRLIKVMFEELRLPELDVNRMRVVTAFVKTALSVLGSRDRVALPIYQFLQETGEGSGEHSGWLERDTARLQEEIAELAQGRSRRAQPAASPLPARETASTSGAAPLAPLARPGPVVAPAASRPVGGALDQLRSAGNGRHDRRLDRQREAAVDRLTDEILAGGKSKPDLDMSGTVSIVAARR